MGAFNISITGVGGHGCERKARAGEKLYGRCGRFSCPDCAAYDFVQRMRQAGMLRDDSQAYNVEIAADDPLVVDYVARREAFKVLPPEQAPKAEQDEISRLVGFKDVYAGPVWRSDSDGKYYRKVPFQATFTHWPETPSEVVDDMLKNERVKGNF